jgi:hypothetical protein
MSALDAMFRKHGPAKGRKGTFWRVVVFVTSVLLVALSAASAMALESTWLVDGAKPAAAVPMDFTFTEVIEDTKAGPFGEDTAIECLGTGGGAIGPGPADRITNLTTVECLPKKLCGTSPIGYSGLKFPWITKIELINGVFYDDIVGEVGEVEYLTICTVLGIKLEDTCKLALARAKLENSGSNVKAVFDSSDPNQPAANCSRGGNGTGLLSGENVFLSTEGLTFAVSEG